MGSGRRWCVWRWAFTLFYFNIVRSILTSSSLDAVLIITRIATQYRSSGLDVRGDHSVYTSHAGEPIRDREINYNNSNNNINHHRRCGDDSPSAVFERRLIEVCIRLDLNSTGGSGKNATHEMTRHQCAVWRAIQSTTPVQQLQLHQTGSTACVCMAREIKNSTATATTTICYKIYISSPRRIVDDHNIRPI